MSYLESMKTERTRNIRVSQFATLITSDSFRKDLVVKQDRIEKFTISESKWTSSVDVIGSWSTCSRMNIYKGLKRTSLSPAFSFWCFIVVVCPRTCSTSLRKDKRKKEKLIGIYNAPISPRLIELAQFLPARMNLKSNQLAINSAATRPTSVAS